MSQEKGSKIFYEAFEYYDRTGMQEFLEQKASEGWKLVRKVFAAEWEFERTEPQKLHYAITYMPQFSNEDEFLASDNKKEYLELCSVSGWQFVCAYKNMVIFSNEEADPLPIDTDPEVELDLIHKTVLKRSLPDLILVLVTYAVTIVDLFFDTPSKTFAFTVAGLIVFSVYTVLDFYKYLRWRNKALAAAATGKFSRTDISNKFISGLLVAVALLVFVIFIAELIVTKDWEMLESVSIFAVALACERFFNKLKKKAESKRERRKITFISILVYIVMIVLFVFVSEIINGIFCD